MTVDEALGALDEFIEQNEVLPEIKLVYDALVAINEQIGGVSDQVAGEAARQDALEEEVAERGGKKKR
jgi:hypothetical protein